MVQALGARVLDAHGRHIADGGGVLGEGTRLDQSLLHPRLADARIDIACDVDNPLTGPHGAAAVYGPQKGASAQDVTALDAALAHFADLVAEATGAERRDDPVRALRAAWASVWSRWPGRPCDPVPSSSSS